MRRPRHWVALILFLFGSAVVAYIWLVSYISEEVIAALDDEAKQACSCKFVVDHLDISLLRLRGTAKNARLVSTEDGKPKLAFAHLDASFGLERISERKVTIHDLRLTDGYAIGFDEESVLYRFIDQLSADPPPGHVNTSLIKARLQSLQVINARLEQTFSPGVTLVANGVSMAMFRDQANDVHLEPIIKEFTLQTATQPFKFGRVAAKIVIKDDSVEFNHVALAHVREYLSANAQTIISQGNKMQGDVSFSLDNENLSLSFPKFALSGSGTLGGHLPTPMIDLALDQPSSQSIDLREQIPLVFNSLELAFSLNVNHAQVDSRIEQFKAKSAQVQLDLARPIELRAGTIDGALKIAVQELTFGGLAMTDGNIKVTSGGTLSAPRLELDGSVAKLAHPGIEMHNLSIHAESDLHSAKIKLAAADERLQISSDLNFEDLALNRGRIIARDLGPKDLGIADSIPIALNLDASFGGALSVDKFALNGQGDVVIAQDMRLALKTILDSSKLNLRLTDPREHSKIEIQSGITPDSDTTLVVALDDFDLNAFGLMCGRITSSLNYKAKTSDIVRGQGSIDLRNLLLGCDPNSFALAKPTSISLASGLISLNPLSLHSSESVINLGGSISVDTGFNLSADANLKLAELIQFIPQCDELQGAVNANANIKGALSAPIINGAGTLRSGEVTIESVDLSVNETHSDFTIEGSNLHIIELSGHANGGDFSISGDVPLVDPIGARLDAKFDDILIQTLPDTTISFGGALHSELGTRGVPQISGRVNVDNAEYQRNIDLAAVVSNVRKFFLRGRNRSTEQLLPDSSSKLPDVDLAIDLSAARNLFVITNFAEAEFRAALKLGGSSLAPILEGRVEALSMWFGLGDKRFEVTSADLRFRPDSFEPTVDLVSEGTFHARSGETTLVVLEAHGALSAPRVTLSSDRGLSEQQILNLIASGYASGVSNNASKVAGPIKGSSFYLLEGVPFLPFESLFRGLATIDSLTLEPRFNSQTAGLDPTVIASKDLGSRFTLLGESAFGSSASEARAKLRLDLSDRLNIAAIVESASGRAHSSVGTDLSYTVLSGLRRFVEITLKGNRHFSDRSLLRALRISESSKIPQSELQTVQLTLEKYYRDQGYLDVRADVRCQALGEFCRNLQIDIFEGVLSKFSGVRIVGDTLPSEVKLPDDIVDEVAASEYVNFVTTDLLRRLRNEGYIRARLKSTIERNSDQCLLILSLMRGDPVSFSFVGNRQFTPAEFLDSINLFERRQPFGSNTINILVRNMASLYQRAGYFDAQISWSLLPEGLDHRTNYKIEIVEGKMARINGVRFHGLEVLTLEELIDLIETLPPEQSRGLRNPKRAMSEDLVAAAELLRDLLVEHGFSQAKVSAQLAHLSDDTIVINYDVLEGPRELGPRLKFEGLPADFPALPPLEPPYSAKRLNRLIDATIESLTDAGYTQASLSSRAAQDGSDWLIIQVDPGVQTRIGEIHIEGLINIPEATVRAALPIKSGDAFSRTAIDASKRALLRLGLFSRIDIGALDFTVDSASEDIVVKLSERPLQSLSVGVGANSELGLHIFAEGSDRSLFKDGRALSLRLDSYYDDLAGQISQGSANLQFLVPQVFGSDHTYTADGRFLKQQDLTLPYDLDRVSLANFLYRSWESGYTIAAGHTILGDDLSKVADDSILGKNDQGFVRLSFLTAAATLERRDDPLSPNSGYAINLETRASARELGSEADFVSSNARATLLLPVSDTPWRFSFLGRGGAAWPFSTSDQIPLSQRFFLGGRNSVRGFGENSLGPRGSAGSRIGGDVTLSDSVELHYIFDKSLYALSFVDSGNVFLRDMGVDLGDFRWSSGLGFRYVSPIGPIGFDFGVPIDRQDGEAAYRLHFNIGSGF